MDSALAVQLALALASMAGVLGYRVYFRAERAARAAGRTSRPMPVPVRALMTVSVVGVWFVMPFLPQPLLGAWPDAALFAARAPDLLPAMPGRWGQLLLGLPFAVGGFAVYVALMRRNATVTARDYSRPAKLLMSGAYGHVRHPVVVARFLGTCGLVLVTGAAYTALLLPLLAAQLWLTARIEEREVLEPCFGKQFDVYRRSVPGFVCPQVLLLAAVLALGLVVPWL
ncbi:methyltransferase [Nitratidesulfovibrio sp. D1]|uniref:methyltransferase n=1 Tax=Nitratidesulfovibrio sp. D1 TaxID=3440151 RepID=UPI003EC07DB9